MHDEANVSLPPDGMAQAAPALSPPPAPAGAPPSAAPRLRVVEGGVAPVYANCFEVRRTPEEVILGLGLEEDTAGGVPVRLQAKIILNFWAAKRLAALLHSALADHERAFGAVELNPQRRLRPAP